MKCTGTDCMVENSRKPNTDYTIAVMSDDDKSLSDKSNTPATAANLFVENAKNKRDKSPTTICQSNGDNNIVHENTADNPRINTENNSVNKKCENQHNGGNSTQLEANVASKRQQKTICYDFKKGMCRRRFCRYPHVMTTDQVVFCHDFQNTGCFRANCRFIHRSIEDEEHYRTHGVFPVPAERPAMASAPPTNLNQPEHHVPQQGPPPLPQLSTVHQHPPSHLNYYPNQDNNMMVSHQQHHHHQQQQQPQQQPQQQQQNPSISLFSQNSTMPLALGAHRRRSFGMTDGHMDTIIPSKRPHMDEIRPSVPTSNYANGDNSHGCRFMDQNIVGGQPQSQPPSTQTTGTPNSVAQVQSQPPPPVASVVMAEDVKIDHFLYRLYEEHNLLRRRVEINEERLQELRATNSYLLQQNEQLQIRRQTQCSCTNTIVNPVTLTTASQQSATPVINAVSIAPVQMQATPIVSIASIAQPQTIITSSTPLAIAANTTQGQQLALASTQQAGQLLGTPQITLAAPSMGITMNTSQPLAMSANATQPIISYPVMTHSILPH